MRRNPSATERRLWKLLRDRKLDGLKFRRQVPIGPYFGDYVCLSCRIIVEADGPLHDEEQDAKRDAWLEAQKFLVLRFSNSVIEGDPQVVFAAIQAAGGKLADSAGARPLIRRVSDPPPSPARGGRDA